MKRRVFYSWEKDLDERTHRNLIEDALKQAVKVIHKDDTIEVEPVIDRDTVGVSGTPDIAATIFEKIDQASVFVADVSIINAGAAQKPTPNPNVLIETGYAIRALTWNRVLLVMDSTFGGQESLPFDLKTRRAKAYTPSENIADIRRGLAQWFEAALRAIFNELEKNEADEIVFAVMGEALQEETQNFTYGPVSQRIIWAKEIVEKAQVHGLTQEQVEEALETLTEQGDLQLTRYSGDAYSFTISGFHRYALKHVNIYAQLLADTRTLIVNRDLLNGADLLEALKQPPLLVEQVLDLLKAQNLIETSRVSDDDSLLSGIRITKVSAQLKRIVREANA